MYSQFYLQSWNCYLHIRNSTQLCQDLEYTLQFRCRHHHTIIKVNFLIEKPMNSNLRKKSFVKKRKMITCSKHSIFTSQATGTLYKLCFNPLHFNLFLAIYKRTRLLKHKHKSAYPPFLCTKADSQSNCMPATVHIQQLDIMHKTRSTVIRVMHRIYRSTKIINNLQTTIQSHVTDTSHLPNHLIVVTPAVHVL